MTFSPANGMNDLVALTWTHAAVATDQETASSFTCDVLQIGATLERNAPNCTKT